ncbi:MAG: N-acyl homoserine lactonase family protein [Pseudomonadota bacterium]
MNLLAFAALFLTPAPAPEVELWRLPCGVLNGIDFDELSDTHRFDGQKRDLVVSCYLIRHGDEYLIWDAGLPEAALGDSKPLRDQLAEIGIKPEQVRYIGVSHRHGDHTGQAAAFPGATLLIGAEDLEQLRTSTDAGDRAGVLPWLEGKSKAEPVKGDKDVFGDGSVTMLNTPGHTAGHHSLLVRLRDKGWVLLSGDLFHQQVSYEEDQVPAFNANRADTLASIARFKQIAANLHATVIVQHEVLDIAELPYFPEGAR